MPPMHSWPNLNAIHAMNFKQLSHFVALVEHRSFVRASEACNITQPAFSRSIRGLEEELGCQLIDRHSGRNFAPTIQGERVLQHARIVLDGMARLTSELNADASLDVDHVRIGCGPVPGADLVPQAIARFLNDHPRMQIRLDVENWQKLVRSLRREELDFLVAASEPFVLDENYEVTPLQPQRMAFFCRAEHPLLQKAGKITAPNLFSYPIGLAGASKKALLRLARVNGVLTPQIAIESDNIHSLLGVIGRTDVIGLIHSGSIERALAAENIVRIDRLVGTFNNFARYAIIQRRGHRLSAAAERLLRYVRETDISGIDAPTALQMAN